MNDQDLQTQLDAYLNRFATFVAPSRAIRIPGKRERSLHLLAAVAVVAMVVAILAVPILLGRFQSRHANPAGPPQPTANVSPRPPLHHNGQVVMGSLNTLIAFDPATRARRVILSAPAGDLVASPAYSPDGAKLAYLRGQFNASGSTIIDSIWVLDTTTGYDRQLTTCHGCDPLDYVSWSPDSSRLVFSEADQSGSLQLHLIDADGTHRTQLTHFPADQYATQPTWSPDGTRIAFTFFTTRNVPNQGTVFPTASIDVIRPDGTGLAVLLATNRAGAAVNPPSHYQFPAWSPDGSRIAYVLTPPQPGVDSEGQYQLWLMNPDGSHRTQIFLYPNCCRGGGAFSGPAWSPDATRIAADIESTLWVMNADGSAPTSSGGISGDRPFGAHPAWQPVP